MNMADAEEPAPDLGDGSLDGRWEAFSDYRIISLNVASAIDDAVDAYSQIRGRHSQNAKITSDEAAEAEGLLLAAALRLVPELRTRSEESDTYQAILERWGMVDPDGAGDGYISELERTALERECPEWLLQFVIDIRTAGWELGYLQAGKIKSDTSPKEDPVEDVQEIFQ